VIDTWTEVSCLHRLEEWVVESFHNFLSPVAVVHILTTNASHTYTAKSLAQRSEPLTKSTIATRKMSFG
jgi:hypothetical protein